MLKKNAAATTTAIPTIKVSSGDGDGDDIVYPDNKKLITKPTDHNKYPSKIVFSDQMNQTTGNTNDFSFQPMAIAPPTTMMGNGTYQKMDNSMTTYTYADCGALTNADTWNISVSADSQFVVFPNGTKVLISKCHVQVMILNRNKSW